MIDAAAGLSLSGKIPFAGSFANFVTSRVYDQIRQCVCYAGANVKIAASHAGITLGEDGATHQVMEDIGMMRMLPRMTVRDRQGPAPDGRQGRIHIRHRSSGMGSPAGCRRTGETGNIRRSH